MIDIDQLIDHCKRHLSYIRKQSTIDSKHIRYSSLKLTLDHLSLRLPISSSPDNDTYFYWSHPDQGHSILGYGERIRLVAHGQQRFQSLQHQYKSLSGQWYGGHEAMPKAFLGYAFDPLSLMTEHWCDLPNTQLSIPQISVETFHQDSNITINFDHRHNQDSTQFLSALKTHLQKLVQTPAESKPEPVIHINSTEATPNKTQWQRLSEQAIQLIRQQQLDKLVFSRKLSLIADSAFSSQQLLDKLGKHYPTCTIIACARNDLQLIAATPERLLSLNQGHISCDAIGGTLDINDQPCYVDLMRGQSSSASKLLHEHAIIVDHIRTKLEPLCPQLELPVAPSLMKLQHLYHLQTRINGQIDDSVSLFDLIEQLHPSPAIGGQPHQPAMQWIQQNEAYDRGWYTGGFGWMDNNQQGEISVLLRCALIKNRQLDLFAGAGLVAESNANSEWHETELKMKTILELI